MKTCKKCGKEFNEELTFCPFCGSENAERKLSYIEKKQARDKDTQIILEKASIQQKDIDGAKGAEPSDVFFEKVNEIKKLKILSVVRIVIALAIMVGCIVWGKIAGDWDIDPSLKILVIAIAFIAFAVAASIFISDIYTFRAFSVLEKKENSIRKIAFTKGPMFAHEGKVMELKTNKTCPCCGSEMHVETIDDEIVLVCDKNREHLYKVDKDAFNNIIREKLSNKIN